MLYKILDDKLLFSTIWSQSVSSWNLQHSVFVSKQRNCIGLNDDSYVNTLHHRFRNEELKGLKNI